MVSRYSTTSKPIFKRESLTYYVLEHLGLHDGTFYKAYDSATSAYLCSATNLEALASACEFLGYSKQKETK